MTRSRSAVLLLVFGTACASAPSGSATATSTTVAPSTAEMVVGSSAVGNLNVSGLNNTVTSIGASVPLSPDSAFHLLESVYTKLQIPIAQESDAYRTIGNDVLKARRKLAGMNMQNVVDCGAQLGLDNAETWDIQMNILSSVTADGKGGSQVTTRIEALGHDPSVSNRDWIPCTSKSNLEEKIANMVKAAAAAK